MCMLITGKYGEIVGNFCFVLWEMSFGPKISKQANQGKLPFSLKEHLGRN